MSDYMTTNCIRIKTHFDSVQEVLIWINKESIIPIYFKADENLYTLNNYLEQENLRIINYENTYYIDIILHDDWSDGQDAEFYMSLSEINNKINEYKVQWKEFDFDDVIILAHQWYNGCDEPYTC
jgi:hypothetical protein